ncbi:MAG TPA: hypothetical protein VHV08_04565 [Pirellulales bacterium]|jgi:hypothetical protein|nr:hypothetical protein [Pirellulales bacterium]
MANQRGLKIGQDAILLVAGLLCFASAARASDDLAARRAELAHMSPAEQQELLRKQMQFLSLPGEEQNRLRALQAAIDADPQSERLRSVLKHYHEWLKTLSPAEREELADLPPEERVARIKQIKERQHSFRVQAQRVEALTRQDMQKIMQWTEARLWDRRDQIISEMTPNWRTRINQEAPPKQRQLLLMWAYATRRQNSTPLATVEQPDFDRLSAGLSEPAQQELAKAADLAERRKIMASWIGAAMHRLDFWRGQRKLPSVMEAELAQFFEHDLRPQQRERLLKMPNEQMREELRRLYFERDRREGYSGMRGMPRGDTPPLEDRGDGFHGKGPRGSLGRPAESDATRATAP